MASNPMEPLLRKYLEMQFESRWSKASYNSSSIQFCTVTGNKVRYYTKEEELKVRLLGIKYLYSILKWSNLNGNVSTILSPIGVLFIF